MKAVVFATLFLGLLVGEHQVELLVAPEVRQVEVVLDGAVVGVLDGEPWRLDLDLGAELAPHELVAIARGAGGEELGRARQWINLEREPFEVDVSITGDPRGTRVARLAWDSALDLDQAEVHAGLDGARLEVDADGRAVLPPHDPDVPHLLRVDLALPDRTLSTIELLAPGRGAGVASAELTAVPVETGRWRRRPGRTKLQGQLRARGVVARVQAVETPVADIVVVVDQLAKSLLVRSMVHGINRSVGELPAPGEPPGRAWRSISIRGDQRLVVVSARSELARGRRATRGLFQVSSPFDRTRGPLPLVIAAAEVEPSDRPLGPQCLADAVAVAGRTAAGRCHRRVVLLILSPYATDASLLEPAQVRRYLEHLNVPLVVWCIGCPMDHDSAWGEAVHLGTHAQLEAAIRQLDRQLDRQTIVWLDGLHLPQEIGLSPSAKGLRIAGRG